MFPIEEGPDSRGGLCVFRCVIRGGIRLRIGDVFLFNTDTGVVTRDGQVWDFGGLLGPTSVIDGKTTFFIGGDLTLNSGDVCAASVHGRRRSW
ncbi:MAG: hypothetical protein R3C45_21405 [Phycisphaerales bacterium]